MCFPCLFSAIARLSKLISVYGCSGPNTFCLISSICPCICSASNFFLFFFIFFPFFIYCHLQVGEATEEHFYSTRVRNTGKGWPILASLPQPSKSRHQVQLGLIRAIGLRRL